MDDLYTLMMGEGADPVMAARAMSSVLRGNRQLAGINAVAGGGLGGLALAQLLAEAGEVGGTLWMQLYMWADRRLSHQLVKRAAAA